MVGGGPAAWAAARACAHVGCVVRLVTPEAVPRWRATYGVWADQLDGLGLGEPWRRWWPRVTVHAIGDHVLPVPYARLDNRALATALADASVTVEVGEAAAVVAEEDRRVVLLRTGAARPARAVVVAAGAASALVGGRRDRRVQLAWGATIPAADAPDVDPDACVLMDWRAPRSGDGDGGPPSFLYAQGLGDGTVFVEETVLATGAAGAGDPRRLRARLAERGWELARAGAVEVVHLGLGSGPVRPRRIVAFGASGGFVHPATGYSLARSLRAAPVLAGALRAGLDARRAGDDLVADVHDALWPAASRRADALARYGAVVLCRLDRTASSELFEVLFSLPTPVWRAYVDGAAGDGGMAATMAQVFAAASPRLRAALATAGALRPRRRG